MIRPRPLRLMLTVGVLTLTALAAAADSKLEELVAGTGLTPALSGLQISLMRGGEPTEGYALGFAQLGPEGAVRLRRDHKIRVASISKLVAAMGVMRLVERSKLDLDEDVSVYLGWTLRNPAFPETAITARQLLAHTSSLRDGAAYFIAAGSGDLRDFFTPGSSYWDSGAHFATEENRAPGRFFSYANLNFGVLATLIERIAGERFDLYMQREVLAPLDISASFNPCAIADAQRAAAFRKRPADGERWDPAGPWVAQVDAGHSGCIYGAKDEAAAAAFLSDYSLGSNATLFSPQGGLRASADDLIRLLGLLARGGSADGRRLLAANSVAGMLAPAWTLNDEGDNGLSSGEAEPGGATDGLMTSYGLSVHRIDMRAWGFEQGPALLLGHLGEAYGVLSHALFDPVSGDGIATIISGTADDPASSPPGTSPLYRVEEEILRWWLTHRTGRPNH